MREFERAGREHRVAKRAVVRARRKGVLDRRAVSGGEVMVGGRSGGGMMVGRRYQRECVKCVGENIWGVRERSDEN